MRGRLLKRDARQWVIGLVLVALVVRALVPMGFMPSGERAFSFQICPDGFPAQLLHQGSPGEHSAHHHHLGSPQSPGGSEGSHHDHGGARAEHCVFAAVASAGPAPQIVLGLAQVEALAAPQFLSTSPLRETQRFRVQQPRAPPALS